MYSIYDAYCVCYPCFCLQDRHVKICQKSAAKRRKVFDSSRQRAEGTDISVLKPMKPKVRLLNPTLDPTLDSHLMGKSPKPRMNLRSLCRHLKPGALFEINIHIPGEESVDVKAPQLEAAELWSYL